MIGGAVGLVTGLSGFLLLKKFVYAVVSREKATVLLGMIQPLLIIFGLMCCAFLIPEQIYLAGLGTAAVIIAGTIISTIRSICANKRPVEKPKERETEESSL